VHILRASGWQLRRIRGTTTIRALPAMSSIVAVACSKPPEGRSNRTLQLLADEMVRLTVHDSVSNETIRRRLDELQLKPWQEKMWCIPKVIADNLATSRGVDCRPEQLIATAIAQGLLVELTIDRPVVLREA
jgi:hypothetical protein